MLAGPFQRHIGEAGAAQTTDTPPTMAASYKNTVTSSFVLSNLHCPTCVSTIRHVVLESCPGLIHWVSPNIVTSVVTVEHAPAATTDAMVQTLEHAGFDVCGVTSAGRLLPDRQLDDPLASDHPAGPSGAPRHDISRASSASRWPAIPRLGRTIIPDQIAQAHLNNCKQCRADRDRRRGSDDKASIAAEVVHHPRAATPSPPASPPLDQAVSSTSTIAQPAVMSTKSLVTVESDEAVSRPTWRASLAIGGMTCAVCVNAISDELNKSDWVSKVAVNLVSNSAVVEFNDKDKTKTIVDMIEDLGYEASVDSVVSLEPEKNNGAGAGAGQQRTVEIRIDGLYCEHCPARVTNSLAGFRRSLDVAAQPTLERPIIKLTYVPEAPGFTVRHILAAIEASDPAFKASIYHPPTLEERSKLIQRRHQRQILLRVIFTGIVCIPTFVIGIVYMSLLPASNEGKQLITEPWTSGISRAQMALFIMATPVYFMAADIFHVRAFKEIRTLWRRGSRTPVLQRFYRFGSMNTLMSLGTTIAYVSSVSQLIAAAADQPAMINDSNFYFDSVVFLTFFLLVGRLIESYSKSKTGDAVEMLGKLRPTTAILVEERGGEKGDATETTTVIQADLLDLGDLVRVAHGASPPADGVVVRGETSFDESSLTGESHLIKKAAGDDIFAGTVNKGNPILARITGAAGSSMLDQIVAVVREGQTKRAPMEQIADLLTTYFVPVVTLVAILTWIIWLSLGETGSIPSHYLDVSSGGWVAFSLQFAIAVFVVACPCGLGLAAPTAIFVAGGMAAKYGILAKGGGEAFEKASRIDCVVFDKTGTLTLGGEPSITDAELFPERDETADDEKRTGEEADLLAALKSLEESSSHPIAKAVVSFCDSRTANGGAAGSGQIDDAQEVPGKGMKATYRTPAGVGLSEILVGNEALMTDYAVPISARVADMLGRWKSEAKSLALAATRRLDAAPLVAGVVLHARGRPVRVGPDPARGGGSSGGAPSPIRGRVHVERRQRDDGRGRGRPRGHPGRPRHRRRAAGAEGGPHPNAAGVGGGAAPRPRAHGGRRHQRRASADPGRRGRGRGHRRRRGHLDRRLCARARQPRHAPDPAPPRARRLPSHHLQLRLGPGLQHHSCAHRRRRALSAQDVQRQPRPPRPRVGQPGHGPEQHLSRPEQPRPAEPPALDRLSREAAPHDRVRESSDGRDARRFAGIYPSGGQSSDGQAARWRKRRKQEKGTFPGIYPSGGHETVKHAYFQAVGRIVRDVLVLYIEYPLKT